MKQLNILSVFIFLYSFLQAQLPPPCGIAGDEPPGCVLCGQVYAGNTRGFNPDFFATDFCGTIENNQWLSFVAGATSATVSITAFNCHDSLGVEMALYDLNFNKVSNCFSSGGRNIPGSVTANGL